MSGLVKGVKKIFKKVAKVVKEGAAIRGHRGCGLLHGRLGDVIHPGNTDIRSEFTRLRGISQWHRHWHILEDGFSDWLGQRPDKRRWQYGSQNRRWRSIWRRWCSG